MHSPVFIALGLGFILMGAGLFALTLRNAKPASPNPTKAQLREQAALAQETKRMRLAAGVVVGFGVLLSVVYFS